MSEPQISYDEPADTLYVSFSPGESATGIELNEHILLRVNLEERRAIGITLLDFSLLAQRTELGPRSFPLTGLKRLGPGLRRLAISLLQSPPVSEYLGLSAFTPNAARSIPITVLNVEKFAPRAA
jgi:uncharacterized protein YuzE